MEVMDYGANSSVQWDDPGSYCWYARHNEGWNMGFCDGHGKFFKSQPTAFGANTYPAFPYTMYTKEAD
jgi:prepilin-type processing-associated H-X9-DG protein